MQAQGQEFLDLRMEPKVCGYAWPWGSGFSPPPSEPSAGLAPGHFQDRAPTPWTFLLHFCLFVYLFLVSGGQSWNRWLSPSVTCGGPSLEAGSGLHPAWRVQFRRAWELDCRAGRPGAGGRKGWACPFWRTPGEHGEGAGVKCSVSSQSVESRVSRRAAAVPTRSVASNNTH